MHLRCSHVVRSDIWCLLSCCCLSIFELIIPTVLQIGLGSYPEVIHTGIFIRSISLLSCHPRGWNCFSAQASHTPLLLSMLQGVLFVVYRCKCSRSTGAAILVVFIIFLGGTVVRFAENSPHTWSISDAGTTCLGRIGYSLPPP